MKSKYPIKKLITLSLWTTTFLIMFEVIITLQYYGTNELKKALENSAIAAIILILNAFANLALLLLLDKNKLKIKWNYRLIHQILSYFFSILIFIIVKVIYTSMYQEVKNSGNLFYILILSILINTLIVTLHNYVIVQDEKINSDMENAQLKVANAKAANQLLRQQIHPHMLFNSLNTIKSLYNRNTAEADEYLACLSDFLRASILNNNLKVISLNDELKLCESFLSMQKIRFGKALDWSISLLDKVNREDYFVPSFSIQPLIENAIKHNELTESYPLFINIEQINDRIIVSNPIRLKEYVETSSGFGLANLAERYKHISDDDVIINNDGNSFSVSIKILNHENRNHRR